MQHVPGSWRVHVPATSANLGPAFDTAGLALTHHDVLDVDPSVVPVVLVPSGTLSTHVARGLLPAEVPHGDAAFTAGRAALLVHALTADPALLLDATEDRLHQAQRAPAMPRTAELVAALRDEGHAAVVSGAGPSVLVLGVRQAGEDAGTPAFARQVAALAPAGWECLPMGVDHTGVRVGPTPAG